MVGNPIERFTLNTVGAVSQLVRQENYYLQALIILYSAIDTLAWAGREDGDVTRDDFVFWVERYMQPEKTLGCTAIDLYGARCGLVHSGIAESRLSRAGNTSVLWYATSPETADILRQWVEDGAFGSDMSVKVVYFTELLATFVEASHRFTQDIAHDQVRRERVQERVRQWLNFMPHSQVRSYIDSQQED